mmetsp:Transcript_24563/g.62534  ORF Transcript_24563/g.62534 Transcript_24563/m.62534 type:complete len:311 (-) Transcript_24563:257-1189(-)
MWPGILPATGWIANRTLFPAPRRARIMSAIACWALATAMPYPGTITTDCALLSMPAASCAVIFVASPVTSSISAPADSPNPPINTSARLRFIAAHIMYDRMAPDAPTKDPAISSSLFETISPAKTPANPEQVFRTQMTTGISAPPMARTKSTPKPPDRAVATSSKNIPKLLPGPIPNCASMAASRDPTVSSAVNKLRFSGICAPEFSVPCSFPHATSDPVKVTDPISTPAIRLHPSTQALWWGWASRSSLLTDCMYWPSPSSRAARPPRALSNPTNSGISIMVTLTARHVPAATPTTPASSVMTNPCPHT